MYKIEIECQNKEDVERVMKAMGLTPSPFPDLPFRVEGRDLGHIEISEF